MKDKHKSCECSSLEKEIALENINFASGLTTEAELDEKVKFLILREMFQEYRKEVLEAVEKVSNDLEKTLEGRYDVNKDTGLRYFVEESQIEFKARCFKEFESLMK